MSNPIRHAFEPIQAEPELKTKTAAFVHTALARRRKQVVRRFALACSLVLVVGMVGVFSYFTPASAISIDVNPSIELTLNVYSRVIRANAYNQDAAQLLGEVSVSHLSYTDAIEQLMDSAAMAPYLSDGAEVEVTVVSDNPQYNEEMLTAITALPSCSGQNVHCSSADTQLSEEAHHAGLSVGKYRAFLELQSYDQQVTVEEVEGLSMHQLHDWIDHACNGEAYDPADTAQGSGYGNGQGYGNSQSNGQGNMQGQGNGQNAGNAANQGDSCDTAATTSQGNGQGHHGRHHDE